MSGYGMTRYWLDDFGRLWAGPMAPESNLHYATFEGYTQTQIMEPIWVLRRSAPPLEPDFQEITRPWAGNIMGMFAVEAAKERDRRRSA